MSASNEWTEWHLTLRGWIAGTSKSDFEELQERNTPSDRVLTCKYREHISSPFSPMDISVKEIWSSDDRKRIDSLLVKYGPCPKQ